VIQESGGSAIAVPTDVTDDAALENLVTETTQAFGRIDILVNNAGMNRFLAPTEDIRISGFDKVIDVNLRGPYVLCQLVGRQMIEQGDGGSIINILTTAARLGIPTHGPYSAAKAGLMRFSEALAFEWGQHKVRVNCIGPGAIQTEMSRAAWDGPGKLEAMEELIPVGRIGQPSDIGYATLFLASEAAAYVTAQTLWVDGGL
jgi:NAD(P)-dependent dehydrogenase (short-subunit alcohol dehydrogenase family)